MRGLTDGKAFQYIAYYRTALGALPNLLAALALFYLFKGLSLGSVRWINALSGTTLGVYILHQIPAFRGFLWNGDPAGAGAPRLGRLHAVCGGGCIPRLCGGGCCPHSACHAPARKNKAVPHPL